MVKKTKKTIKKKIVKKKSPVKTRVITRTTSQTDVEKTLVNNFIALQKVMTNLALKFDDLSNQLSKLLDLFQISAKALAEKDFEVLSKKEHEDILKRLDNMSEQNKVLAKGLTLLHEPRTQSHPPQIPINHPQNRQIPLQLPKTPRTKELKEFPQKNPNPQPIKFKKL